MTCCTAPLHWCVYGPHAMVSLMPCSALKMRTLQCDNMLQQLPVPCTHCSGMELFTQAAEFQFPKSSKQPNKKPQIHSHRSIERGCCPRVHRSLADRHGS